MERLLEWIRYAITIRKLQYNFRGVNGLLGAVQLQLYVEMSVNFNQPGIVCYPAIVVGMEISTDKNGRPDDDNDVRREPVSIETGAITAAGHLVHMK